MSGRTAFPDTEWEPTSEFWAAAARGVLSIPRCGACQEYVWYPLPVCRACGAEDVRWVPMSGRGALFSWAVVERALFAPFAERAPYVPGLVALEEDSRVRIVTNLVDCESAELHVDMPVRAIFRDLTFPGSERRVPAPFFTPSTPLKPSRSSPPPTPFPAAAGTASGSGVA